MARSSRLSNLSVTELQREIRRRERSASRLIRRRRSLLSKLAALDAQIAEAGVQSGGRTRPKNKSSLVEALRGILTGKSMSVTDAAAAVQKAGYKTGAANFRTMVNIALSNKKNKFKRVERGIYTAG